MRNAATGDFESNLSTRADSGLGVRSCVASTVKHNIMMGRNLIN
jgi:hypothetical protein